MYIFLFLSADIIFSTLAKNVIKNQKLKKRSMIIFLVTTPLSFLTKNCLYLFSINDFFAQITFSYSLRGALLVQEVSKFQYQYSNHNCLPKLHK